MAKTQKQNSSGSNKKTPRNGALKNENTTPKSTPPNSVGAIWSATAILLPILLVLLSKYFSTSGPRKLQVARKFQSRFSPVYIIPNFLPHETAVAWRTSLQQLWNQTLEKLEKPPAELVQCQDAKNCPPVLDSFTYTTNNDGVVVGETHNAKNRSLVAIDQRRAVAQIMKEQNSFAYSKWELDPSHPLLAEMERTLTDPELLQAVTQLLRQDYPTLELSREREMADIFATHFGKGDFLSAHDDGSLAPWAVVVNLVEDNFDGKIHGGALQFQCPGLEKSRSGPDYCETLYPTFNTAVIFATRVLVNGKWEDGPNHKVLDVVREQGGRYALTGWWNDAHSDDSYLLSAHARAQREMARGRK